MHPLLSEILALEAEGLSRSQIGERLGVTKNVVTGALQKHKEREIKRKARQGELGLAPVLPGFEIASTKQRTNKHGDVVSTSVTQVQESGDVYEPDPHMALERATINVGPDMRIKQQWLKLKAGSGPSIEEITAAIEAWAEGISAKTEISHLLAECDDTLSVYPLADWHLGMLAWGKETGTSWDLRIAQRVLMPAFGRLVQSTYPSRKAVILGGGDLIHMDTGENVTARSKNHLDVDGRYPRVIGIACDMTEEAVELALQRHEEVEVRLLKGNHDDHSHIAVLGYLRGRYKGHARVTVNLDPSPFWYCKHGRVMLAATHGHEAKLNAMPQIMAARQAEMWGQTRHRYALGFHIHHTSKGPVGREEGGALWESFQSPAPQDAWHYGCGFLSGRSMVSITYHPEFGEIRRCREVLIDG